MEGEWEEKYWNLIGKIAAEQEEEERHLKEFLPHFFVLCNEDEKKKALKKIHERIVDDEWIGNSQINGRPMFVMETEESKKRTRARMEQQGDQAAGKDKRMKASIMAIHALMWAAGKHPTGRKRVASHVCHFGACLDPDHVEWESQDHNMIRERCNRAKHCSCGLQPPCNFSFHPDRHVPRIRNKNDKRIAAKTKQSKAGFKIK